MIPDPIPYNQVSRLAGRLHLGIGHAAAVHLGTTRERGVVALIAARLGAADWVEEGRIAPPAARRRFGSINALSRSLGRPFETVRRHVHGLARDGLVTAGPEGVAMADTPEAAPRIVAFYMAAHDLLLHFVEELAVRGLTPPPRAARGPATEEILTLALDVALLPFEHLRTPLNDWTALTLWSAIAAANVRHVLEDPVLDARYAVDYVDDALRRPVTLAALAEATLVPYATAWRHVRALEEQGLVERRDHGLTVATRHYRDPAVQEGMRASAHYYLRRVAELCHLGLDARTASTRRLGPVPVVPSVWSLLHLT